jgi:hypothetical protein
VTAPPHRAVGSFPPTAHPASYLVAAKQCLWPAPNKPRQAPPDVKPTYGTFLFLDPHVRWTRGTTPRPAASGSISRNERGHDARARGPRASIPLLASALPQRAAVPLASGATTETALVPPVKRVLYIAVSVGLRGFPHHHHSGPATTRCVRGGVPPLLSLSLSPASPLAAPLLRPSGADWRFPNFFRSSVSGYYQYHLYLLVQKRRLVFCAVGSPWSLRCGVRVPRSGQRIQPSHLPARFD